MSHEYRIKQLRAAIRLPGNSQKSYKFFCRGLDIRVPEVVKTEMCYISPFEHPLEHDGDGVGIEGGNMSKFADSARHKCGCADISVRTACLGSFQVPFFIGAEDKGVMDVYYIALDIIKSEGANLATPHHSERAEENRDFQFRAPYGINQGSYLVIRGDIKLRTYFLWHGGSEG